MILVVSVTSDASGCNTEFDALKGGVESRLPESISLLKALYDAN